MKQQLCDVLGHNNKSFKVPINIYESVDEAEKAAGKEGAVLAECNRNLLYRGAYNDARWLIETAVFFYTKTPFKMVTQTIKKDGKDVTQTVRDPKDTEKVYTQRALDGAPEGTFDRVQELVTSLALGEKTFKTDEKGNLVSPLVVLEVEKAARKPLAVDIRATERSTRIAKLAQKWKDIAISFLDTPKRIPNLNKEFAKFNVEAFKPTGKREEDVETLGWKCKAYADAQDPFSKVAA